MTYRSQQDIISYIASSGMDLSQRLSYAERPSTTAPYDPGSLSAETQANALATLNVMRYIAGLDANVALDSSYAQMLQAAALLNAANGQLTHTPARPAGMSDELYELGSRGASSGNLSMGYSSPAYSVLSYVSDSDPSNIAALGHRRWVLNPTMGKTGFGQVGAYSGMYAFDRSNSQAWQTNVGVAPRRTCPRSISTAMTPGRCRWACPSMPAASR